MSFQSGADWRATIEARVRNAFERYEQALRKAQLRIDRDLVTSGDFSCESGIRATEGFLASGKRFSAIFCANDEMAIGAMQALRARGLRVPQDVSIVGFDDIRFARYTDPPLTTIAQPKDDLGKEAMTALLEILDRALEGRRAGGV